VTDYDAAGRLIQTAIDEYGKIDILVNNAGIVRDKSLLKMGPDDYDAVVKVHQYGTFNTAQHAAGHMKEAGYGRIINVTSQAGLRGNFGQTNYGAAKMALVGLMQTLAIEGEKYGIRVNCLAPTAATAMTEGVLSPESLRLLDPARVSPGLLALVSEDAPTRTILCAGAGNFAAAHVTLTHGYHAGAGADAGEQVIAHWRDVTDRAGEIVPDYGFTQAEREVASAGLAAAQIVERAIAPS
jgi:NAD(P)-dependent dehydrogenase (short-subunit alcohol dehydrogenase family)